MNCRPVNISDTASDGREKVPEASREILIGEGRNKPLDLGEQLPTEQEADSRAGGKCGFAEARVFREARSQARNCCLRAASAKDKPSKLLIPMAEAFRSHQLRKLHERSRAVRLLSRLLEQIVQFSRSAPANLAGIINSTFFAPLPNRRVIREPSFAAFSSS